jgi:hypothetical protein
MLGVGKIINTKVGIMAIKEPIILMQKTKSQPFILNMGIGQQPQIIHRREVVGIIYTESIGIMIVLNLVLMNKCITSTILTTEHYLLMLQTVKNNKKVFKSEYSHHFAEWKPFDHKFYLILSAGVGGNDNQSYGGAIVPQAVFPCTTLIDYVRVYKRI